MKLITDVIIALLLLFVLGWCCLLFWGAYSGHSLAVLLNKHVLMELKSNIVEQIKKDSSPAPNPETAKEIEELEKAQRELFDTNTVSFLFQFITLLLVTIGAAILGLMYRQFSLAQKHLKELQQVFVPFVQGTHITGALAVKYCCLYMICRFYQIDADQRSSLAIKMSDFQQDILRYLEDAEREKKGFEPLLHELVLDMALQVDGLLTEICSLDNANQQILMERILGANRKCRDILDSNGLKFREVYDRQLSKVTGE